mmetsp:Transcript_9601/g.13410  ORF Transcript_9601/g.13410 Transcript_9601/m.13410 type:complete len:145 (+) Transcript_9601:68-502(+)
MTKSTSDLEISLNSPYGENYDTDRATRNVKPVPVSMIPRPDLRRDSERDLNHQPIDVEPYYWDKSEDEKSQYKMWRKIGQNLHYYGCQTLDKMENIGEVVADALGFTQSKYQYVINSLEQEEKRAQEAKAKARDFSSNGSKAVI